GVRSNLDRCQGGSAGRGHVCPRRREVPLGADRRDRENAVADGGQAGHREPLTLRGGREGGDGGVPAGGVDDDDTWLPSRRPGAEEDDASVAHGDVRGGDGGGLVVELDLLPRRAVGGGEE